MKEEKDAVFLAELMVQTGERMAKSMAALITDMDQPLGRYVGNSLEVIETLDVLRGEGPEDLRTLCVELAGWMFHLGKLAATVEAGKQMAAQQIQTGRALEEFRKMVELQGGDPRSVDDVKRLPSAQHTLILTSPCAGYISRMDCEAVGTACVVLGGGRSKMEDIVDPAVGIVLHRKVGDSVSKGDPLCTISYYSQTFAGQARAMLLRSYSFSDAPPGEQRPLIHRVIRSSGGN